MCSESLMRCETCFSVRLLWVDRLCQAFSHTSVFCACPGEQCAVGIALPRAQCGRKRAENQGLLAVAFYPDRFALSVTSHCHLQLPLLVIHDVKLPLLLKRFSCLMLHVFQKNPALETMTTSFPSLISTTSSLVVEVTL